MIKNLTITFSIAAALGSLTAGAVASGNIVVAAVTGAAVLVGTDALRKSKVFSALSAAVTEGIDKLSAREMSDSLNELHARFKPQLSFFFLAEPILIQLAGRRDEFRWLTRTSQWLGRQVGRKSDSSARLTESKPNLGAVLPRVSANLLSGLTEAVAGPPYSGKADVQLIASALHMDADDLFPIVETMQMLQFAQLQGNNISLTDTGWQFANAEIDDRKRVFQRQLLSHVPLAAHIRSVLQRRADRTAPKSRFLDELKDHMIAESAEQTLRAVTAWARYSESFAYDDEAEVFALQTSR